MSAIHKVSFRANPTQLAFIQSKKKADLFLSRMGEGKSTALVWSIFYHTKQNPGARWALVRDTWKNLEDTTLQELWKWFPQGVMGRWFVTGKKWVWRAEGVEGEIQCLGLDDPKDAAKLQSRELAGIAIDEPAPALQSGGVPETVFDVGFSRLRQTGMKWYGYKLAANNPDETHWSYRRFIDPGDPEFGFYQTKEPENESNLPEGYYDGLRRRYSHRRDFLSRFVEGKIGFVALGESVTPEWRDEIHLARRLEPVPHQPLTICWDFGHNPTAIVTQMTPVGHWLILDGVMGDQVGTYQLVEESLRPLLQQRYKGFKWWHTGDPAGTIREQADTNQSPVRLIQKILGGGWRMAPVRTNERIEPLRSVLSRLVDGKGLLQVDRQRARIVWQALRGGWCYRVTNAGIRSIDPQKNIWSHPGDALGYGAAVLFPLGRLGKPRPGIRVEAPGYFGPRAGGALGFERPGLRIPGQGEKIQP